MGQTNVKNLGNGGTMDGDVTITGDLTVSGGISLSLNEVLQGTSTIEYWRKLSRSIIAFKSNKWFTSITSENFC